MDENTKKKIALVRDLIKKSNFQEALDQAEIIIYKNSKIFQAHLMAGLCYEKLSKFHEAQKSYKQVLDLKPGEPNALKAICDLYSKMGRVQQSTKFMEEMLKIQKDTEPLKYRQNLVKLVDMYHKKLDLQKIDAIFKELLQSQKELTEEFVKIAEIYFKTAVQNQCFFLQNFLPLGVRGEQYRTLQPSAKQKLNNIMVEIVHFLYSVKIEYKMSNKDISGSIYQMRQCFPYASCFLMLFLLDEYITTQSAYNSAILQEIYMLLTAYYDKADNCYLHLETLEPECFVVSVLLSYEYLAFMKQFFILDQCFNPYFDRLGTEIDSIGNGRVREQYRNKIDRFILKECRTINKISETQQIENRLQSLKYRIVKLDGSYLQEVVAKMAMNCFVNYQKLCDMRNLLKTRINNLKQGEIQPHLYKYYYDYLLKIAKLYKALDEQLSIYDVIHYIYQNEKLDHKYLVEYSWIQVGRNSKKEQENFIPLVKQQLLQIQTILPQLTGSIKSQAIRKTTVLNALLENYGQILDGLKLALGTDRSFENLQCIGFYYFIEKDFQRSLRYLKEAFIIRQNDYHLNRAIFVAMVKLNETKQAYSFLERIYEGFPNVYWVNFALAINSINNKKIQLAYKYLSAAFQAFQSGVSKAFKFSYEKTIEGKKYSLIYMIDQNDFHILEDHIVVPEQTIFELFPIASSYFFNQKQQLKQIKLQTQLGEILKILGRNKSSYNHLASAHAILSGLPKQVRDENLLQVIATKKQFATMLFYVRAYKQAEQILREALKVCDQADISEKVPQNLLSMYQSQIHSLLFEVSVMRLDDLMKFESYEAVQEYITKFNVGLQQMKASVKKPSLNYYKAKYQFYILCYLHNKKLGVEQSMETIQEFLNYFGLDYTHIESDKFYNKLQQLGNEQRIIVKECLEDYYVLLYMRQNSGSDSLEQKKISAEAVMPLIQLFPTSSVFYIVYGMAVTETKLKIAAFLKCIQLDRQSPISVDLLASLFLKQKDYLTACKLFLKSLEIDLFNPKSYIGLCTCLYVLIGCSIKRGAPEDKQIIRKALNKVNSYMQFLRLSDPSENYHMLKFLRTLISDEPIPLFDLKAGLEQSRKLAAHKYSQKLLFQLLQDSTQYLKDYNTWKLQDQHLILQKYLQSNQISCNDDLYEISRSLLAKIDKEISDSNLSQVKNGQIRIKIKCKFLNKMCIVANTFIQAANLDKLQLDYFIKICDLLQERQELKDEELLKLQKTTKDVLISAVIKSYKKNIADTSGVIQTISHLNRVRIFKKVPTFSHIQIYLDHFTQQKHLAPLKKYIIKSVHLYPCDPTLRKVLLSWLILVEKQNNKAVKKIKAVMDYRLEGILQMNTDEQANNTERFHKKFAIMCNVDEPNAWVGFIEAQWTKKKQPKWSQHLLKLLKLHSGSDTILTRSSKQKALTLLTEMAAEKINNSEKIDLAKYPPEIHTQINALASLVKILKSGDVRQIGVVLKNADIKTQLSLAKYIIPYFVNQYENSAKLEELIDWCIDKSQSATQKGFYYLLKFVSICSKESKNEDELVDQLKKQLHIILACESSEEQKKVVVHQNSLAIMKCMVALLSLNYEQLEQQLNNAYGNKLVTYSDQVLINFFEVMKSYKQVETNHQGENVFENFTYFVDCMITMAKQPKLKGFFYSLKAMAQAILAEESSSRLSRQLKLALLLAPVAGHSIIAKN